MKSRSILYALTSIIALMVLSTFASAAYYDSGPYHTTYGSGSTSYDKKTSIYERTARTGYDYDGKYVTVSTVRETTRVTDNNRYSYNNGLSYIKPLPYRSTGRYSPRYTSRDVYGEPYYYQPHYNGAYYDWRY